MIWILIRCELDYNNLSIVSTSTDAQAAWREWTQHAGFTTAEEAQLLLQYEDLERCIDDNPDAMVAYWMKCVPAP